MPLYTSVGGARKQIPKLYSGVGGVLERIPSVYAGVAGVRKAILNPDDIKSIRLRIDYIRVFTAAQEGDKYYTKDLVHSGNGYGSYADIELTANGSSFRLNIHPRTNERHVLVDGSFFAVLQDDTQVRLSWMVGDNSDGSSTISVNNVYFDDGRWSGSSGYHGWYWHPRVCGDYISDIGTYKTYNAINDSFYAGYMASYGNPYLYIRMDAVSVDGVNKPIEVINPFTP